MRADAGLLAAAPIGYHLVAGGVTAVVAKERIRNSRSDRNDLRRVVIIFSSFAVKAGYDERENCRQRL
jgi:hypothetical protein